MAEVHTLRTTEFPDGIEHTESHRRWPGLTALRAYEVYEERAKRLRTTGADAVFDRRDRIITVKRHCVGHTEIETIQFHDDRQEDTTTALPVNYTEEQTK